MRRDSLDPRARLEAGEVKLGLALAPAHDQRVEDDEEVQRDCGECPQRVRTVAEEAELTRLGTRSRS